MTSINNLLKSPVLSCLLLFFGAFAIGLYLFLPLAPFAVRLQNLATQQQILLQINQPHRLILPGIGVKQVTVSSARLQHAPVKISNLQLRPLWTSLFGTNPGAGFNLNVFRGKLSGTVRRNGELTLDLSGLQLKEKLPDLPLSVQGVLSLGTFDGQLPVGGKHSSDLKLTFDEINVQGLKKLGGTSDLLNLGALTLVASIDGNKGSIDTLRLDGPALSMKGKGTMRLGRNPASSSINLNLVVQLKEGLDPALADMIRLLKPPQSDGSIQVRVSGSLANPRVN